MRNLQEEIEKDLEKHPVILYMKGTDEMPMCGFSGRVVEILNKLGINFESRNILEDEELRAGIKEFSSWPTLPQLYIKKKFVGGCDIVMELFETGELQKLI